MSAAHTVGLSPPTTWDKESLNRCLDLVNTQAAVAVRTGWLCSVSLTSEGSAGLRWR